jgi:hypothetical protein
MCEMPPPSVLKDLGADTLTFGGFFCGGGGGVGVAFFVCTLTEEKVERYPTLLVGTQKNSRFYFEYWLWCTVCCLQLGMANICIVGSWQFKAVFKSKQKL